jgi:hypothetical protein
MASNDTTFIQNQLPVINAAWLNDVGAAIWGAIGTGRGGTPPTTAAQVLANLGIGGGTAGLAYTPPGSHAIATTVGIDLNNQFYNIQRWGGGIGVADNTTAINNAIQDIAGFGGGYLYFSSGTYNHASPLMQASGVVMIGYGAILSYSGSGVQITSPTTGVLNGAGIVGMELNAGSSSTKILELYSPYSCQYIDVQVNSVSITNIALDILANLTGGVNGAGNRNPAYNYFSNWLQQGTCGTGLRMTGQFSGSAIPATLNTFVSFNCQSCAVYGINFVAWCDSNYFAGVTRLGINGNNGVGVVFNSGSPTLNVGVYSNNFDHLAVDTFAGYTGRVGIQMNFTKLCNIRYYFNDPAAEGGPFLTTANTQSYNILHQVAGTGNLIMRNQLTTYNGADQPIFTVGGGGDISTGPAGISVGPTRSGSGIAYLDLIGDTTYTTFGAQLIRQAGANGITNLYHRGTGGLVLQALDAGGYIELLDSVGTKGMLINNAGIGVFSQLGSPAGQSTGWGTPVGGAVIPNYNITDAGGASSNTNKAVAQIIAVLKAFGWMGT